MQRWEFEQLYEEGKLLILDNFLPGGWLAWIWDNVKILDTQEMRFKKAKPKDLADIGFLRNFTNEHDQLKARINELYKEIIRFIGVKFKYKIESENWTWRLTKTDRDAMHLDSYAEQNNDLHNLRVFVNLDQEYRTWRTSYPVEDIMEFYVKAKSLYIPNKHPNEINDILNSYIVCDSLPYHEIKFAPGTLWMANTQIISHQGWYGNRMAAYTFRCTANSMRDISSHFIMRVANKYKELYE